VVGTYCVGGWPVFGRDLDGSLNPWVTPYDLEVC